MSYVISIKITIVVELGLWSHNVQYFDGDVHSSSLLEYHMATGNWQLGKCITDNNFGNISLL